jgi:tetratricopeptide (TPR) repeat protein
VKSSKVIRNSLLAVFCVVVVSGCQVFSPVGSFFSQRYTNVISYFNTFYNARQAFDDGETDVASTIKSQQGKLLTLQEETNLVSANARLKFTSAIEKASKLLSYYPNSKFVDDALLMIGESYYYLNDDLKAERKFLELFAKFPESDLIPEAQLWYGRTLLREKKYDDAQKILDNTIAAAKERGSEKFGAQAAIALGRYYNSINDFQKAIDYFQRAIDLSGDGALKAQTQLRIGFCYAGMEDYPNAEKAFEHVDDFSPDYYTQFQGEFQRARMLGKMQKYGDALGALEDLLNDQKNAENAAKLHLAIANIYLAQGRTKDAIDRYTLIDTVYAKTDESARSYYNLGRYYELQSLDYAKARTNYDKAKAENPASEITKDAYLRADMFAKYFTFNAELVKDDSIITYIERQQAMRDSIAQLPDSVHRSQLSSQHDSSAATVFSGKVLPDNTKSDSLSAARALTAAELDSLRVADSLKAQADKLRLDTEKAFADSMKHSIVRTEFELGDLFYLDIDQPDSAMYWYQKVITEHPASEYAPRALYTLAEIYRTVGKKDSTFEDSLYSLIVEKYPQSLYAQEARKSLGLPLLVEQKDPAESLYRDAETYFDSMKAYSAFTILDSIARNYRTSHLAPKALYSIGWLYEYALGKKDSASFAYRKLLTLYPDSKYAVAVRPMIQAEDQQKMEEARAAKEAADKAAAEKAAADKKAAEEAKKKVEPPSDEKKLER